MNKFLKYKYYFVGILIGVAIISIYHGVDRYFDNQELIRKESLRSIDNYIPTSTPTPTLTPSPTPIPNEHIEYYKTNFKELLHSVPVSAIYMEFDYIGDYYITAYCPEECGYNGYNYPTGWVTATGTICHREEEWWNPSTCGINTSINHYGDLFLIDGKVFVAEDTGPGAVGHWIDTFMPDYESMSSFGSHWTEVYSVSYVETDVRDWHFDFGALMKSQILRKEFKS